MSGVLIGSALCLSASSVSLCEFCLGFHHRGTEEAQRHEEKLKTGTPNAVLNVPIAHVSCIIVGLVIRPKYPEVNS